MRDEHGFQYPEPANGSLMRNCSQLRPGPLRHARRGSERARCWVILPRSRRCPVRGADLRPHLAYEHVCLQGVAPVIDSMGDSGTAPREVTPEPTISPWRIANQPSGSADHARQPALIRSRRLLVGESQRERLAGVGRAQRSVGPQAAPPRPVLVGREAPRAGARCHLAEPGGMRPRQQRPPGIGFAAARARRRAGTASSHSSSAGTAGYHVNAA